MLKCSSHVRGGKTAFCAPLAHPCPILTPQGELMAAAGEVQVASQQPIAGFSCLPSSCWLLQHCPPALGSKAPRHGALEGSWGAPCWPQGL